MIQTAQLFITCIVDTLYPEVGESVVRVLRRAGVRVEFPGQDEIGLLDLGRGSIALDAQDVVQAPLHDFLVRFRDEFLRRLVFRGQGHACIHFGLPRLSKKGGAAGSIERRWKGGQRPGD